MRYKIVRGTAYREGTPDEVIEVLEKARKTMKDVRLKIYYGDTEMGLAYGTVETGYIGRSTGRLKRVLIIAYQHITSGPEVLTNEIVKIKYANKRMGTEPLYQHPNYYVPDHLKGRRKDW